eukprot:CAMPEP_0184495060 /NCGR_PEP_ID=MMETSP0113_2-20130426/30281_1 /TAXON_ID=91329 /ORGANISM="Norrisiella sphaerica, Strain BC52" /LENGTH=350 /DNA_ID=CAMNT_0026881087 /DNA_START=372 /DNA_END=1424 /DNA_ORIENTATION=+
MNPITETDEASISAPSHKKMVPIEYFGSPNHFSFMASEARAVAESMDDDQRRDDPFVAICLTGNARTLKFPSVYGRLKTNLIDKMSNNTYVFSLLKAWDTGVKKQKKFGFFRSIPNNASDLEIPLNVIWPAYGDVETRSLGNTNDGSTKEGNTNGEINLVNSKCQMTPEIAKSIRQPEFFAEKENTPRLLGQMHTLSNCYDHMRRFEIEANITFDAVIKTRPDAVYFLPSKPAKEYLIRQDLVWHFSDIFIFSPRRFAEGFVRWYSNYTACHGPWEYAYYPEEAFRTGFNELGAIYYYDHKTPVSLRRASREEESAVWVCRDQHRISVEACMETVYDVDEDKFLQSPPTT